MLVHGHRYSHFTYMHDQEYISLHILTFCFCSAFLRTDSKPHRPISMIQVYSGCNIARISNCLIHMYYNNSIPRKNIIVQSTHVFTEGTSQNAGESILDLTSLLWPVNSEGNNCA